MRSVEPVRTVKVVTFWQMMLLFPFALLLNLWGRTLRMDTLAEDRRDILHMDAGFFLLWHNRLLVIAELFRRFRSPAGRKAYGLISASRDGAWLEAFFRLMNINAIRGSSSWRGAEGLRDLIEVRKQGGDIALTPDGPRGPCYDFKPGAVLLARKAPESVRLIGVEFTAAWRLPSWDGFYIPRPFSRVIIRIQRISDPQDGEKALSGDYLSGLLRHVNPDSIPIPERKRKKAVPV